MGGGSNHAEKEKANANSNYYYNNDYGSSGGLGINRNLSRKKLLRGSQGFGMGVVEIHRMIMETLSCFQLMKIINQCLVNHLIIFMITMEVQVVEL